MKAVSIYTNYGFSLIELLITLAIIGILISMAAPNYQHYVKRAHYSEIVMAAAPYKIGVEECFQINSNLTPCITGKYGIPPRIRGAKNSLVNKVEVKSGTIYISPNSKYGIKPSDNYVLTPSISAYGLTWTTSGSAKDKGYI